MTAERITCPNCKGSGYEGGTWRSGGDCKTCNASGYVTAPERTYTSSEVEAAIKADRERVADNACIVITQLFGITKDMSIVMREHVVLDGEDSEKISVKVDRSSIIDLPIEITTTP